MRSFSRMVLRRWVALSVVLVLLGGCASAPKLTPEISEQMRQLSEMRDTCTQYYAWLAKEKPGSEELRRSTGLYIAAQAAANAYLEQIKIEILSGGKYVEENYASAAEKYAENSQAFLDDAQRSLGLKQRGVSDFIFAANTLIGLAERVNNLVNARNHQRQEMMVKALDEVKWKPFNEIVRP